MLQTYLRRLSRKSFTVALEDKYCYPAEKDFVYPNHFILQAALENHFLREGSAMEYLSKNPPIRFILNDKTKYEATLRLGRGRFNQGYYIQCTEITEDFPL